MHWINRISLMILTALSFVLCIGGMATLHAETVGYAGQSEAERVPLILAHQGSASRLDRPPVSFEHDRHTTALKMSKEEDCAVCHVLKETDRRLTDPEVKVFKFPKTSFDATDKTAIMYAYHTGCVSCHRQKASQGKKTGPDIGMCGKCHARKSEALPVAWARRPVFNYLRHSKHVQAGKNWGPDDHVNVAGNVHMIGQVTDTKCEVCHHTYDAVAKKLIYKKDTENACGSCHKANDDKNARSLKNVAHAACIGCHAKLSEKAKKEALGRGKAELTAQEKKQFGPVECAGCHGERKELTPEEIAKIPRLVRGQKDVIDLALKYVPDVSVTGVRPVALTDATAVRMKVVPFNHKAHEPRAQFCNTCHHHSLEKCENCHSATGAANKGGNVSYEQAFHRATARQSCVGCHDSAKEDRKCVGCHQWKQAAAAKSSCPVCHTGTSAGNVVETPPIPLYQDKEKVPEKLLIKGLEKEFNPADMPHMKIVNKLVAISNDSSLARRFHATKDQALCSGCHHRSDLQQAAVQAPKCSTCHGRSFDVNALGRPGVLAAYHRQCMGCHQAMGQLPIALECVKCHPAKEAVQTAGFIPTLSAHK